VDFDAAGRVDTTLSGGAVTSTGDFKSGHVTGFLVEASWHGVIVFSAAGRVDTILSAGVVTSTLGQVTGVLVEASWLGAQAFRVAGHVDTMLKGGLVMPAGVLKAASLRGCARGTRR